MIHEITTTKKIHLGKLKEEILESYSLDSLEAIGHFDSTEEKIITINTSATLQEIETIIEAHDGAVHIAREQKKEALDIRSKELRKIGFSWEKNGVAYSFVLNSLKRDQWLGLKIRASNGEAIFPRGVADKEKNDIVLGNLEEFNSFYDTAEAQEAYIADNERSLASQANIYNTVEEIEGIIDFRV